MARLEQGNPRSRILLLKYAKTAAGSWYPSRKKTASERNNAERFVTTIAHQIALAIPTARELIGAAVDYNPFIFKQSVDVQFAKLVI